MAASLLRASSARSSLNAESQRFVVNKPETFEDRVIIYSCKNLASRKAFHHAFTSFLLVLETWVVFLMFLLMLRRRALSAGELARKGLFVRMNLASCSKRCSEILGTALALCGEGHPPSRMSPV